MSVSRRGFVRTGASLVAATGLASLVSADDAAKSATPAPAPAKPEVEKKPEAPAVSTQPARPGLAVIGCGGIARFHARYLPRHVTITAVADVDKGRADSFNKELADGKAFVTTDYRNVLSRSDVEMVLIATPDHWHTKILLDAVRAGKDVYCEKPLTLTIDEGRIACQVTRQTGRIVQIGTQQRSEEQFLKAVALAHLGRLGTIRSVTVAVGDTPRGADFETADPPPELDWDMWLGQAPRTPYIKQRCHYDFRWWYEYSGGRMTDWGAHHVDIAQWAIAPDLPGPARAEPLAGELPVPYQRGWPTVANAYNTATKFNVKFTFANGVDFYLCDRVADWTEDNGILLVGDGGTLFVNRKGIHGPAVDALKDNPLPAGAIPALPDIRGVHERHFVNFLDCVKTRALPKSDIFSHVRHLDTCHLANIALRMNRRIRWDATAQEIANDPEANALQYRAQRTGYEVA